MEIDKTKKQFLLKCGGVRTETMIFNTYDEARKAMFLIHDEIEKQTRHEGTYKNSLRCDWACSINARNSCELIYIRSVYLCEVKGI